MITVRSAAIGAPHSALGLLSGCSNTEKLLLPENEIPELRTLGEATRRLPHRLVVVQSEATEDSPLGVAVHEHGPVPTPHESVRLQLRVRRISAQRRLTSPCRVPGRSNQGGSRERRQ